MKAKKIKKTSARLNILFILVDVLFVIGFFSATQRIEGGKALYGKVLPVAKILLDLWFIIDYTHKRKISIWAFVATVIINALFLFKAAFDGMLDYSTIWISFLLSPPTDWAVIYGYIHETHPNRSGGSSDYDENRTDSSDHCFWDGNESCRSYDQDNRAYEDGSDDEDEEDYQAFCDYMDYRERYDD